MNDVIGKLRQLVLLAVDILLLYGALALVLTVRYWGVPLSDIWHQHSGPFSVVFGLWLICFYIAGLYDSRLIKSDINFYVRVLNAQLINAAVGVVFFYVLGNRFFSIRPQVVLLALVAVYTLLFLFWRRGFNQAVQSNRFLQNVIFIGSGQDVEQLTAELKAKPYLGYRVIDIINIDSNNPTSNDFDLKKILQDKRIQVVVTSLNLNSVPVLVKQLYENLFLGVDYFDLPGFYERVLGKVPVNAIGQLWFLENIFENEKRFYEVIKRILDVIGAGIFGVIGLALTPLIALAIRINSKGPVVFKQRRVGKHGKQFLAMKFRSMREDADSSGPQWTEMRDPRVTAVGKFLRKTKLDEIPQLINILRGEMSFIGPRPEQPEFVAALTQKVPYYNERHLIKPGLTGWAQIHFPYASASVEDTLVKLQHDLYYVKNRSLLLDLGVILKTINTVLSRQGR